jgi:large subunit ribosomal protein L4e
VACQDQPRTEVGFSQFSKVINERHILTILVSRRFATTSALAASAVPALLLARGHRVSTVPEVPLVISSKAFEAAALIKTSAAVKLLKTVGAGPDIVKAEKSKTLRAGKGKLRGRRYRHRRGPLIVFDHVADGQHIIKAFKNVTGAEASSVHSLNLLQLAPGGHLGRFIIWTSNAFAALDKIYGSTTTPSSLKKDFLLPSNIVTNSDIARLINSSEVQAIVRPVRGGSKTKRAGVQKKNPLKNKQVALRLNPYAAGYRKDGIGHLKAEKVKPKALSESFTKTLKSE